ncbi:Integrase [Levilactobacillus brevis]|nr:Integrase [Levilactobacillus brevis]
MDYFTEWFKIFRKPNIADATAERYQYTINTITKYFGNTLLRKMTRLNTRNFSIGTALAMVNLEKTHSKESAAKINVHIRAAVRNAVNDGVISRDFTLNTHIVFDTSNTREIKYLSYKDAAKLYQVTMSNLHGLDVTSYMCLTALLTGMRQQEIAGLTWKDIDVKGGTIDINKSWNWKKRDFGPTKNPYSVRKIKVDRNLINILQKLHYEQELFLKIQKRY